MRSVYPVKLKKQIQWNKIASALLKRKVKVASAVKSSVKQDGKYYSGYLMLVDRGLLFFFSGFATVKAALAYGIHEVAFTDIQGLEGRPLAEEDVAKLSVQTSGQVFEFLLRCPDEEAEAFASGLSALRQGKAPRRTLPLVTPVEMQIKKSRGWIWALLVSGLLVGLAVAAWLVGNP